MIRKISLLLVSAIAIASHNAFADSPLYYLDQKHFSRGFFSIGAGSVVLMSRISNSVSPLGESEFASSRKSARIYNHDPQLRLALGVGRVFSNNLYLGASLGADLNNRLRTTLVTSDFVTNSFVPARYLIDSKIGSSLYPVAPFIDIKFGKVITPHFLMYLSGGIDLNRTETISRTTYHAEAEGEDPNITVFNRTNRDDRLTFHAGLHLQYVLTKVLAIEASYVYKASHAVTVNQRDVLCDAFEGILEDTECTVENGDEYRHQTKARIGSESVMLSLVTYFND